MTQERLHQTTEMRSIEENPGFFIGPLIPFVGLNRPLSTPFVCLNMPFIEIAKKSGFTLIELVVTLSIIAILATVAVPELRTFIWNSRLSTQSIDLISDLNLARNEAIKLSRNAGVCVGSTAGCAGADWSSGRAVISDNDNSNSWTVDDVVVRAREALGGGNTIKPNGASAGSLVVFNSQGTLNIGAGIYVLCDNRGLAQARAVEVTVTGQVRTRIPVPAGNTCL